MGELERYTWPGNVRELQNVLERAVLLTPGESIATLDLPTASPGPGAATGDHPETLRAAVERAEREAIRLALQATRDNKARAAELLGISVRTLWYKIDRLGLADAPPSAS